MVGTGELIEGVGTGELRVRGWNRGVENEGVGTGELRVRGLEQGSWD